MIEQQWLTVRGDCCAILCFLAAILPGGFEVDRTERRVVIYGQKVGSVRYGVVEEQVFILKNAGRC